MVMGLNFKVLAMRHGRQVPQLNRPPGSKSKEVFNCIICQNMNKKYPEKSHLGHESSSSNEKKREINSANTIKKSQFSDGLFETGSFRRKFTTTCNGFAMGFFF
ncbi:hypothetical protein Dimus_023101 [Dionaea muscipula]